MRPLLLLCSLISSVALANPNWRTPTPPVTNCAGPSAACLASSYSATAGYTFTGASGVAFTSTQNTPLEMRSGATGSTAGFKLYTTNNLTGTILDVGEIISGTPTSALYVDQNTLFLTSRGIELQGAKGISSNGGGSEDPLIVKGGVVSTASTSRVFSAQDGFGNRKLDVRAGAGGYTVPGSATGSLVTCNGSATTLTNYDTTTGGWKYCDGTAYRAIPYVLPFEGTQDVASVAAHDCETFTVTATGVVDADVADCDEPSNLDEGLDADCETRTDAIHWDVCNYTAGAIDPPSGTFRAKVIRP